MHRSSALILFLISFWSSSPGATELCGFPGRDGEGHARGVVNLWLPGAPGESVPAGARELPVGSQSRGTGELQTGDLLLVVQMQGATLDADNSDAYGDGAAGDGRGQGWLDLQAGKFEFVRLEAREGNLLRIRGGGVNGGLVNAYVGREAGGEREPGDARWQVVRVPQFENLSLTGPLQALPWDGRSGGVLALDVRRRLALNGHRITAGGMGFRGGAGLTLAGALGDERDFVYRAPGRAELAAGFGQHASKGEGVAGTPRWVAAGDASLDTRPEADRSSLSDGYPSGSMAKGAPGNAGGGGVSLRADNRVPSGGGGGGGGLSGTPGQGPAGEPRGGGGGAGVPAPLPLLVAGGGGGAGTRSSGTAPQGDGGAGGGIVLIRAGILAGPGSLSVRGAPGAGGEQGGGGGGGAGGTLWVQAPVIEPTVEVLLDGGPGGEGRAVGGDGGGGRFLAGGGSALPQPDAGEVFDRLERSDSPGVAAGWVCRPAGMLLAGTVFNDNGAGGGTAHDGFRHREEDGLGGVPVVVRRENGEIVASTRTAASGQFSLELGERWAGTALVLDVDVPVGWHPVAARSNDLPLAPFRYRGDGDWTFSAAREYQQDGLALGLIRAPGLEAPSGTRLIPGSTRVFLFRYIPHTEGRVRFRFRGETSAGESWPNAFFLDPDCDEASEYVDRELTRWVSVTRGEPVCARVRVDVPTDLDPAARLVLQVDAETDLGPTPLGLDLEPLRARITTGVSASP